MSLGEGRPRLQNA